MISGSPDRWHRVDDLFDAALDLPAERRSAFLDRACPTEPDVRVAVERLLRTHGRAERFLEVPAPVFGAALIADSRPIAAPLTPGTRIGAYTILDEIGHGGMGVVYKARDERLDRLVALKFLPADIDTDPGARRRLMAEAKVASALDHPGIATVLDIGETETGQLFIAMACYEGETLRERIARGRLPMVEALEIASQLAAALGAAHRKGVIHRDIKPANVIVTGDGIAKIVDFGIAQIAGARPADDDARGTLAYMSPEQLRGESLDQRTDVWSLGVVLDEMLTGRCRFPAPAPSPPGAIPPEVARIVERCLARDRAERYPSTSELLAELQRIRSALERGASRRHRWPLALGAAAGVAALGTVGALLLRDAAPPRTRAATTSPVAQRFFEEGLRTYYRVDVHRSNPYFRAALREDSLCALCAYYAAISENDVDPSATLRHFHTAVRLASRVSERDRLHIRVAWNWYAGVPSMLPTAESLAVHYPNDPEAQFQLGRALSNAGRFMEAVPHLRRAVEMDSLGLRGVNLRCRACDAEDALIGTYFAADSLEAAERVAREWIRAQPRSRRPWSLLAEAYRRSGRYAEARVAQDSAVRLGPVDADDEEERAWAAIRRGDFPEADAYFSIRARNGTPSVRLEALWWRVVSLRNQGRLREAWTIVERARPLADSVSPDAWRNFALARGQLLFELGRFREAAELFESLAHERPRYTEGFPGIWARVRVWAFTHQAAALAALGDTAAVEALADSLERLGPRSAYGRDHLLHHHLQGLLLIARNDPAAAEAEFREAIYSPTSGYTRTNLELARVLLSDQRPREAVAVLEPALRGPLEASNYYVTRTDLHALLGRAWEAAGQPDSAAVQYRRVLAAWHAADPRFHARRDSIRARLDALSG